MKNCAVVMDQVTIAGADVADAVQLHITSHTAQVDQLRAEIHTSLR